MWDETTFSARKTSGVYFSRGWEIHDGVAYIAYTLDDIDRVRRFCKLILGLPGLPIEVQTRIQELLVNFRTIEKMMLAERLVKFHAH